ncbi:hypothetical protein P8790_17965, partial [Bacillus subtilis]|uniref:hypothetical protein n=1 Tax=Bacillus subtilis TaxID=1423 RepID=UPI002DBEB850
QHKNQQTKLYLKKKIPTQHNLFNDFHNHNKIARHMRTVTSHQHEKDTVHLSLSFILLQKNGYFKEK